MVWDFQTTKKIMKVREKNMSVTTSIIMTTYNGEPYLIEQLDSIRKQTLQASEVLIYDDGSKDKTAEILKDYIVEYDLEETWHFQQNEKNLGYADNFYQGIAAATGDYIFFADQDDVWLLDRVEQMVSIMQENANIQLLSSEFEPFYCGENADNGNKTKVNTTVYTEGVEFLQPKQSNIFLQAPGCAMVARKTFIQEILPYWYSGFAHDEYVWKLAWCLKGIAVLNKPTLKRRYHENNVSMNKMRTYEKRLNYIENLVSSYETMKKFLLDKEGDKALKNIVERNFKSSKYRFNMLKGNKIATSLASLILYLDTFQTPKTLLVEGYYSVCKKIKK